MEGGKESMVGCINTEIKAQKVGLGEREKKKKKKKKKEKKLPAASAGIRVQDLSIMSPVL